jgi:hypothetical protein
MIGNKFACVVYRDIDDLSKGLALIVKDSEKDIFGEAGSTISHEIACEIIIECGIDKRSFVCKKHWHIADKLSKVWIGR